MEAGPGAHFWAREIGKLGHDSAADESALRQALRQEQQERR